MSKDDATWLNVVYAAFMAIIAYVGFCAIQTVGIQTGWDERFAWFGAVSVVAGIAIGIGSLVILRSDPERHQYLLHSIGELRKVAWPSVQDVKRMTMIVCLVCGFFAIVVSILDFGITNIMKWLIA